MESFQACARVEDGEVFGPELRRTGSSPMTMGEVVRAVSCACGDDAVCVTDVGQNQMMAARYCDIGEAAA